MTASTPAASTPMTFDTWLEQEESQNGGMGLSQLERDQMRMAWCAALAPEAAAPTAAPGPLRRT